MASHHAVLSSGLLLSLLSLAQPALAGPCGQPISDGPTPTASDALAALKTSVGGDQCGDVAEKCQCDVDSSGSVTASDALRILRAAIQKTGLAGCCGPDVPCSSLQVFASQASLIDWGWTGGHHDLPLPEMPLVTMGVAKRCADDDALCSTDADCGDSECVASCNCAGDPECELAGPVDRKRCLTTLSECSTNADCPVGVSCVSMLGPPLPVSTGFTPVCLVSFVSEAVTGTADVATGELSLSASLQQRVALGIAIDQPCPRCGPPESEPKLGDQFTCEGGREPGAACTVDAVGIFGGTSFDCAPQTGESTSTLRFPLRLGTSAITKTATLPCANFAFQGHPTRGNAKCTDRFTVDGPLCTSNADCQRCTGAPDVSCASNADCEGSGTCAEAPEQPVTCGFWCHCGFCNDVATKPCMGDGDCAQGETCVVGTGSGTSSNSPQQKPNDCGMDGYLCGTETPDRCANTMRGRCELEPFRSCNEDSTCLEHGAGQCQFDERPCFGSTITRQGEPAALGSYCRQGRDSCSSNADCAGDDPCVDATLTPTLAGLACTGASVSSTINAVTGITGPMAFDLKTFIKACYCGDADIGCAEECDDGNLAGGDGCDESCRDE